VTQAHGIEFVGVGSQGSFDIAQTFAPGQLREGQHPKLFGTCQSAHSGIAGVAIYYAGNARPRTIFPLARSSIIAREHGRYEPFALAACAT
jgi:hypothetical protein